MSRSRVPFPLWLGVLPLWLGIPTHFLVSIADNDTLQVIMLLIFLVVSISIYMLIMVAITTNWRGTSDRLTDFGSIASSERSRDPFTLAGLTSVLVWIAYAILIAILQ